MLSIEAIQRDRELVEDAVRSTPRPEGVGKPQIDFSEDHSGDESVYITFPASKKIKLTPSRVKQLTGLADAIREKLYERRLTRSFYVRFSESR